MDDGRIRVNENGFYDYCGHSFQALLYVYPNYAKQTTLAFLENCVHFRSPLRIIGSLEYDFEGQEIKREFSDMLSSHMVNKNDSDWIDVYKRQALLSLRGYLQ